MADVDIDPYGEHEWRPDDHTDENSPLDPCRGGLGSSGYPSWKRINFGNRT